MGPTEFIATLRKGKPGAAYFLRGPDRFLHEECRAAIVSSVPEESRQWCLADIEFRPGRLRHELEAADQMPMLGGHSFFLFSDPEDFKQATDDDYEALGAYLQRPSPFATVVFAATEPDRRRRFVQLLEKKAHLVEIRPLQRGEAAAWLKDYLARAGTEIAPGLAAQVAGKFESGESAREGSSGGVNLLWMRTEIEKLLTARPAAKRLQEADLELIVSFREEREIGKMLRAIAERKCGEALEYLRALLASKVAETLLLWCIADLFRQALKAGAQAYGRGQWGRAANPFSTWEIAPVASRAYAREELLQALRLVRRADLSIKSSWKDSKILLEFLVWQIVVGKGSESLAGLGEELPSPPAEG
jgi:DNA polymerase III delta subunit